MRFYTFVSGGQVASSCRVIDSEKLAAVHRVQSHTSACSVGEVEFRGLPNTPLDWDSVLGYAVLFLLPISL
jgi:hypothetical protein